MPQGERSFLPGCYRNMAPELGESFLGFLLNLSQNNGYSGIVDFLKRVFASDPEIHRKKTPWEIALQVQSDPRLLLQLGQIAAGDGSLLTHYKIQSTTDGLLLFKGCYTDIDAWMGNRSQICTRCLSERKFALAAWDFSPVVVCPEHKIPLIETCPYCGGSLLWSRQSVFHCGGCGADLRSLNSEATAERADCSTCRSFGNLEEFKLSGTEVGERSWLYAFRVVKSLALKMAHFRACDWPGGRYFADLPIVERTHHLHEFAVNGSTYPIEKLRPVFFRKLACLEVIPRSDLPAKYAYRLLKQGANLPQALAADITGFVVLAHARAIRPFDEDVPHFHSRVEAEAFLGVDSSSFNALRKHGLIHIPARSGDAYDLDDLLKAQEFMAQGLLTVPELSHILGVQLNWEDFQFSRLLTRWNKDSDFDFRVDVAELCELQLRIHECCSTADPPCRPLALASFFSNSPRKFQDLSTLIDLILSKRLRRLSWGPPFVWGLINADCDDLRALASALTPKLSE